MLKENRCTDENGGGWKRQSFSVACSELTLSSGGGSFLIGLDHSSPIRLKPNPPVTTLRGRTLFPLMTVSASGRPLTQLCVRAVLSFTFQGRAQRVHGLSVSGPKNFHLVRPRGLEPITTVTWQQRPKYTSTERARERGVRGARGVRAQQLQGDDVMKVEIGEGRKREIWARSG